MTTNDWLKGAAFVLIKLLVIFLRKQLDFVKYLLYFTSQTSINSLIFNKTIRTSPSATKTKFSEGEIVNFSQSDNIKIGWAFWHIPNIFGFPIQLIILFIILYYEIGLATFATAFTFLIMFTFTYILLTIYFENYMKFMASKDKRIKQTTETLNGLKNLKLNGWDEDFLNNILETRLTEASWMDNLLSNINWRFFMGWAAIPIMMATTIGVKFWLDGDIEINVLLTTIMIVDQMKGVLEMLPTAISLYVEALVGFKRIENYMKAPEVDPTYKQELKNGMAIQIEKGTFSWGCKAKSDKSEECSDSSSSAIDDIQIVLKDIDLSIKKGELVAIIGEIGSGKSSLLNVCMNNLLLHSEGTVKVDGTIAYVSQNSWIQNKTLKENILFYNEYDEERYEKVLTVCELTKDLENFEGGDATEIGEKGINLSGGQKARVAIARAVYENSDIILLDDPISALDAHVGKTVMKKCIVKFLKGKTRILVTHAIQYLKYCDEIIYMSGGSIAWKGNYSNLQQQEFYKNIVGKNRRESIDSVDSELENNYVRKESAK